MGEVVIGAAAGYNWDILKPWVLSGREHGYNLLLVATDIDNNTIKECTDHGVTLFLYGDQTENGVFFSQKENRPPPHVERFIYIQEFIKRADQPWDQILLTDTRDVVFQSNIFQHPGWPKHKQDALWFSTEGLVYEDEPWGANNFQQAMGMHLWNEYRTAPILNVGVWGGTKDMVLSVLSLMVNLSANRPIAIVDQAIYNYIMGLEVFRSRAFLLGAINLGTTLPAVEAGAGDLGRICKLDSFAKYQYITKYMGTQPLIEDGKVYISATDKSLYPIVHQWDRVPDLNKVIQEKYV